jgi:hypothetical protein
MHAKTLSLICTASAIALASGSWADAAVNSVDDGRSSATKPPPNAVEMTVAQAWWDAAYDAATAQRQGPVQQAAPARRYRR